MNTMIRGILLLCLVSGLLLPSTPASAQAPRPPDPQALQLFFTEYKTLVGLDFRPSRSDLTYSSINDGIFALNRIAGYGFFAPLNLPDGANVTEVKYFFVDNSDTTLHLSLVAVNPETDHVTHLNGADTTAFPSSSAIRELTVSGNPLISVDTATNAYRISVEFGETGDKLVLYGVRVKYTLPLFRSPGDETITIAGGDFRATSSLQTYSTISQHLYGTNVMETTTYSARLDLPNGAKLKQVDFFVIDNDVENIDLYLFSYNPAVVPGIWVKLDTSSLVNKAGVQKVTLRGEPIITADTALFADSLHFTPKSANSNHQIVGARARYTPGAISSGVKTKTYTGMEFSPTHSALTYIPHGAGIHPIMLPVGHNFQIDLGLPAGVLIRQVQFYFIDNSDGSLWLSGRSYLPQTGHDDSFFYGDSTLLASADEIRSLVYPCPTGFTNRLDLSARNYRLRVDPSKAGANLTLMGARVEYYSPRLLFVPQVSKQ